MPYHGSRLAGHALALAALLSSPFVHAQAYRATAALEGLQIQLIDLDPNDNITPAFEFVDYWTSQSSNYNADPENGGSGSFDQRNEYGSTSVVTPAASGTTSSTQGQLRTMATLEPYASPRETVYTYADQRGSFRLTPNTRLTFSISASMADNPTPYANGWAAVNAYFYIHDEDGFSYGDGNQCTQRSNGFHCQYVTTDTALENTLSGTITTGNRAYDGTFFLSASTLATQIASAPPVPEPQTYAMLLAGLALTGWCARRRRQA